MKTLCLNCRGLGQPEAVQELRSLIQLHRPWLVFLSETRFFYIKVDRLQRQLGFANGFGVGSFGRGGGLALLWTRDIDVHVQRYNKLHIDAKVHDPGSQVASWRFTGFYGESKRELRYRSWELMKDLHSRGTLPWLCAGDFNETLDAAEQIGGLVRPERQMEGFRDAVEVCSFADLGFQGLLWTWDNSQEEDRNIKVRLDRGLATTGFLDLFKDVKVWHVQTTESDHCCLVIESYRKEKTQRRGLKQFRYENMWSGIRPILEWSVELVMHLVRQMTWCNYKMVLAGCRVLCKSGIDLPLDRSEEI